MKRLLALLLILAGCDSSTPPTAQPQDAGVADTGPPAPLGELCTTENTCGPCGTGEACVTDWFCQPGDDGNLLCDYPGDSQFLGDDRCHRTCEKGEPCPSGETCKRISFYGCTDSVGPFDGKAVCTR